MPNEGALRDPQTTRNPQSMDSLQDHASVSPSRQAIQAKTASKPNRVTGKLAVAIDLMIESGLQWDKAAIQAGLTVRSMRLALERPHVVAHLKAKREVFRIHASAGNIHRLVEMRDQDENKMAAVQAIKTLEQIGDEAGSNRGVSALPGLQIVVVQAGIDTQLTQPMVDVSKNIEISE